MDQDQPPPQDNPLPFADRCIIHEHGRLKDPNKKYKIKGKQPRMLRPEWCVDSSPAVEQSSNRASVVKKPKRLPTTPAEKAPRKPRKPLYDSLVKKRCGHPQSDWELCACAWHYHVTHNQKKFRNPIPDATSYDDAKKKYQTIRANIQNGRPPLHGFASPGDGLTVAQLGEDWLKLPRGRKPTTITSYQDHLRAQINPVLGSYLVTAVTAEDCERLILGVKSTRHEGKELSTKSKKSMARTLHALFQFAIEKRKRTDNPATLLTKAIDDPNASPDDGVVDPNDHTKYFTQDEAQKLLATCQVQFPDWFVFVLTGLQTGVRLGELRGLCYEQINWHGGYINVDQAYVKDRWTTPKNGKPRNVTLSRERRDGQDDLPSLRTVLRARRQWRRDSSFGQVKALYGRPMHLVFPSAAGTPLQERRIGEFWGQLLGAAGLGYRVRHAMRHTHDSLMLQNGAAPAKVAAESGRSLHETMKTYAHFLPGGNREEAEMLSSLLKPKTRVSRTQETTATNRPRRATKLRVVSQQ